MRVEEVSMLGFAAAEDLEHSCMSSSTEIVCTEPSDSEAVFG